MSNVPSSLFLALLLTGCSVLGGKDTDVEDTAGHDMDSVGDSSEDSDSGGETDTDTGDTHTGDTHTGDTDTDTGTAPVDADGDGYNESRDCDDDDPSVHPGAEEVCNNVDDDCDGTVDDGADNGIPYYSDRDHDGFGAGAALFGCTQPGGTVTVDGDCDDAVAAVNPGATEVCNRIDDDCNGAVDDGATDPSAWYPDTDGDTHGDEDAAATYACSAPAGYVASNDDCDDRARAVNPDAVEVCDGIDNDCDGAIDEAGASGSYTLYPDNDGDGYGSSAGPTITSCSPVIGYSASNGDCNDADFDVNPGAEEVCDGIDNDCDGVIDGASASDAITVWPDRDSDGYGDDGAPSTRACTATGGFVTNNDDCDDTDRAVNPGADEVCDGIDNDCDGVIDGTNAIDMDYYYRDADFDGFGEPDSYGLYCYGVENTLDCNDHDANEPQVVDASSTATSPDGSIGAPWYYIQDGIDAANECVLVRPGLYGENLDFGGKDILVWGERGATTTVIDGGHVGAVVTFATGEGAGAELRGFSLVNGTGNADAHSTSYSCGSSVTCTDHYYTLCGGGIYADGATPTLSELVLQGNDLSVPDDYVSGNDSYYFYSFGGGICVRNAAVSMSHVSFIDNLAEDGGAAYVESTGQLSLTNALLQGNQSDFGGGVEVDGGRLTLLNALLTWNAAATSGGGVYSVDSIVDITNVTVGECEAAVSGGGIEASGTTTMTVRNSIVYGANAGEGVVVAATATYTATYSDVYGNAGGEYLAASDPTGTRGNISANPAFTSVTDDGDNGNDDWTLGRGSVCINTGDSLGIYNDTDGTRNDMGAYGGPEGSW